MNFLGIIIALILLSYVFGAFGRDTTDGPKGRSGMMLFTDHATGVQYVGNLFMGFTVRVGRDGKPYSDAK